MHIKNEEDRLTDRLTGLILRISDGKVYKDLQTYSHEPKVTLQDDRAEYIKAIALMHNESLGEFYKFYPNYETIILFRIKSVISKYEYERLLDLLQRTSKQKIDKMPKSQSLNSH